MFNFAAENQIIGVYDAFRRKGIRCDTGAVPAAVILINKGLFV